MTEKRFELEFVGYMNFKNKEEAEKFAFELEETNYIYTGREFTPSLTRHTYNATNLVESIDYVISYLNNINAGTGSVIITGINNYTGVVELNFNIAKKQA